MPDSFDLIDAVERHVGVSGSRQRQQFTSAHWQKLMETSSSPRDRRKRRGFPRRLVS
jgi:hypothetical protein